MLGQGSGILTWMGGWEWGRGQPLKIEGARKSASSCQVLSGGGGCCQPPLAFSLSVLLVDFVVIRQVVTNTPLLSGP